ncbi:hypothetical protein PQJ75_14485 [Rhodoplanes sp. TEM]|uniref:DUF5666 domain-containing protein n=1 Tax=Rhodoplanes tepidamans TaxID=200616 RepID=A0ABT5JDZ2_RHOTP|nr:MULTISPECIES: hypothetical protein [Rhodoplanes]MDC7787566.1 hypothetical protein [Rhodoplanes tepidamans]MDC7984941.1 hypothetical protein [Rhodoplanes sp. TEM]MDQ0357995.1 hypothetical protein [Rhodoplanes tepidamans]
MPVAVVEEVKGKVSGLEFMDYVEAGRVIKLGAKDTIVLGYMKSCLRETITGGTVVVGTERSLVHQGRIDSVKVECDATAQLAERQSVESAATVFRRLGPPQPGPGQAGPGQPAPGQPGPNQAQPPNGEPPRTLVLFGRSPVFEVKGPETLTIERLDKAGEKQSITLKPKALVRGRFYDMARADKALAAGGSYVATVNGRKVAFKIAADARPGATAVVGRLVRFE